MRLAMVKATSMYVDPPRPLTIPVMLMPNGRWMHLNDITLTFFSRQDVSESEQKSSLVHIDDDGRPGVAIIENWRDVLESLHDIQRWHIHAIANPEEYETQYWASKIAISVPPKFESPIGIPPTFRDFYAFEQHVKTARAKRGLEMLPAWYEFPAFYFSNPGSLIGHEAPVCAPQECNELDFELELGLIIGEGGKDIPEAEAWKHVAGFTIINDFSARDIQRKEMSVGLGPAKAKDFATAVGPYLVTLDEFQDRIDGEGRIDLEMIARVNGKELSRGNAKSMHFTWPRIIAHASRDAELFSGDLIGSGTVGTGCILELGPENTGGWLKPGDVVELEIERLGVLRTPVESNSKFKIQNSK